jgi:hypothetical protein
MRVDHADERDRLARGAKLQRDLYCGSSAD